MRNALDEILFGFFGTPVGLGNMGDTEGPPRTIGETRERQFDKSRSKSMIQERRLRSLQESILIFCLPSFYLLKKEQRIFILTIPVFK
jgi:hypothetical protein